jgi:polyphenol oxidase
MRHPPELEPELRAGLRVLTDRGARARGVLVAFSDRRGGVSAAPFDSLNLAARAGDDPAAVETNRRRIAAAAGFELDALALARQVHGIGVVAVSPGAAGVVGRADGLIARVRGVVLGMLTADCAAVVVAGGSGVAVLHAGWRGLASGVIERGVAAVGPVWGAWVGPSIRACCYEVGDEVAAAFARAELPVAAPRRVDVGGAAAFALRRAGIEDVALSAECTSCSPRYFSYRRDGVTGRQGAFAALVDST